LAGSVCVPVSMCTCLWHGITDTGAICNVPARARASHEQSVSKQIGGAISAIPHPASYFLCLLWNALGHNICLCYSFSISTFIQSLSWAASKYLAILEPRSCLRRCTRLSLLLKCTLRSKACSLHVQRFTLHPHTHTRTAYTQTRKHTHTRTSADGTCAQKEKTRWTKIHTQHIQYLWVEY